MSDFDEQFEDDYDDSREEEETPGEAVERLRREIADGEIHLRPELAEALMLAARQRVEQERYEEALESVAEALEVADELIDDGQVEFLGAVGRCLLFRAVVIRLHKGDEAALLAFNEAVRYFSERTEDETPETQNELAVALVNKADLLINPFGAHSAAIAAQEQAIRIWRRQVENGETKFRHQLASALLNCGDAKLQSGDPEKALGDYQSGVAVAKEALEDGEAEYRVFLVQAQMKLTKLYEQVGDISHAFETSAESIRLIESLIDDGDAHAEVMLTALCLQHGLLFEQLGDSRSALEQFDRCRDIYLKVMENETFEEPGEYIIRTGLANVMMCRGNMLADLRRFDEAAEAFEESVRIYRQAGESRPEGDHDETFIPYSIGVVRLNHANMLAALDRLDEAVAIKEESLEALRQRLEAGHEEILPNLISAYRKMVVIRRQQGDADKTAHWIERLIRVVDAAVDDGHMEYRSDLALAYHLRSMHHEERDELEEAERDLMRSLRLFREIADEQSDSSDVQMAKLQWGELLERLALLYSRQGRNDDALAMFQQAIDDVLSPYDEGSGDMVFDILLGYTQMLSFVDGLLRKENGKDLPEDRRRWARTALDAAASGIDLSRRQRVQPGELLVTNMFFTMKIAFFSQIRGSIFFSLEDYEKSDKEYADAIEQWETLLHDVEQLRDRHRYFEEEPGKEPPDDPYRDRYLYYMGELRQTLQRRAQVCLARNDYPEAERHFRRDIELARKLIRRGIPDADRFLVLSLVNFARSVEDHASPETTTKLFEEARELLRARLHHGPFLDDDFFMFRHVHVSYALFLLKTDRVAESVDLMDAYMADLEADMEKNGTFPAPALWVELCNALEIHALWHLETEKIRNVRRRQRRFLVLHPDFDGSPELREYDETLQKEIESPESPGENEEQ